MDEYGFFMINVSTLRNLMRIDSFATTVKSVAKYQSNTFHAAFINLGDLRAKRVG
jgi:hypothetical protein